MSVWLKLTDEELKAINNTPALAGLATRAKEAIDDQKKAGDKIQLAQAIYADDSENSVEVDPDAAVSINNDGTWVQAWVWVEN
jgi:hypothetical protein